MAKVNCAVFCRAACVALGLALPFEARANIDAKQRGTELLTQAENLPTDFAEHFFDVPLMVSVDYNGHPAGSAMITLSREGEVHLIELERQEHGTTLSDADREKIMRLLKGPRTLGACEENCGDLLAIHYNLQDSVLSIVTRRAEQSGAKQKYHARPQGHSNGLILNNFLNAVGGNGQGVTGRYSVDALGSIGQWGFSGSLLTGLTGGKRSEQQAYAIPSLYVQREFEGRFLRAGVFVPDLASGVRTPRTPGGLAATTLGVLYGTSDTLVIDGQRPSLYPVYVTANRPSVVEVLRDRVLIFAQPVQPGLQVVDTYSLPGGIYEVEIRIVEDGKVVSSQQELIYKPNNWLDPTQSWRYALFAGQERDLVGDTASHALSAGAAFNYLATPRVVLGATVQRGGGANVFGISIDWQISELARCYGNVFRSSKHGMGGDIQLLFPYRSGSISLSHNRSWQHASKHNRSQTGTVLDTALTWSHRLSTTSSLTSRATFSRGRSRGFGGELSLLHRHAVFGVDCTWRASLFDRPNSAFAHSRNRGAELGLSIYLSKDRNNYNANLGLSGGKERGNQFASIGVRRDLDGGFFTSVGANASIDSLGFGLGGTTQFQHEFVRGDAYASRSSNRGGAGGGINMSSTVVASPDAIAVSGLSNLATSQAVMIVDVETESNDIKLHARNVNGTVIDITRGRNIFPVSAFEKGSVHYYFDQTSAPAASLQPATSSYHVNKGGVAYQKVRVMKTVTVMGRLVAHDRAPVRAVRVASEVGRAVTEADGFFAIEASERTPHITVERGGRRLCELTLDTNTYLREGDSLIVGDLVCAESLSTTTSQGHDNG
ncbi:pilus assembly protein PapC [Pandoraea fibrosis]|uniref:Pilus assembly protein PapC n=1 Tax=Pandoraea fibrosis TaxID=1891094 RepID=A0ABX6HWJ2_9BURK|nr:CS1-pili formation C-terminal domain-containing protein [Pandoraea fibrosis]QHE91582.1 pilus assembly protein PapC [Pandoraea fibrosis]QHF14860.1 pilus assembly protein PapC [Pandoraea fibrosis]